MALLTPQRKLAKDVAHLRTQLALQQEEHKALVQSLNKMRQVAPPPTRNVLQAVEKGEVVEASHQAGGDGTASSVSMDYGAIRKLKADLAQQACEAKAAKAALNAELQRQVGELRQMHDRMTEMDEEKKLLRQQVQDLGEETRFWKEQAGTARGGKDLPKRAENRQPAPPAVAMAVGGRGSSSDRSPGRVVASSADSERVESLDPSSQPVAPINHTNVWSLLYGNQPRPAS